MRSVVSRRSLLKGTATAAVGVGAVSVLAACGDDGGATSTPAAPPVTGTGTGAGMDFTPVAPNTRDAVVVPEGYEQSVVIRWGDPVMPALPRFDMAAQTPEAQEKQFGFNNDFAGLIPIDGEADRFYLVCNQEYTTEEFMFTATSPRTRPRTRLGSPWPRTASPSSR